MEQVWFLLLSLSQCDHRHDLFNLWILLLLALRIAILI